MAGALGAALTLANAAASRAQGSGPVTDSSGRDACLSGHEQSQELRLAGKLLASKKALLSCAEEQCPAMVRADCLRWLDEVEGAIPTIVVVAKSDRGDEFDVRVIIDGNLATSQLDGKPIELDPGSHQILFDRSGSRPQEMRLILGQGEKNRILRLDFGTKPPSLPAPAPTLAPASLQAPTGVRPVPAMTYVFGGVAAAAVASATYFGLKANAAHNDAMRSCAPLCSRPVVDDVKQNARYSDFSTGIAVLSAGTAVLLYVTRPTVFPKEVPGKLTLVLDHWRFGASPESAFTTVGGTF